jgi:VanZ family protein
MRPGGTDAATRGGGEARPKRGTVPPKGSDYAASPHWRGPASAVFRLVALWIPVLGWAALIFYFSSLPHLRITQAWWDLMVRKIAHLAVFGVLAWLIARALAGSAAWREPRLRTTALSMAILYAMSDEVHQSFVPGRYGSWIDVAIDGAGASLALALRSWRLGRGAGRP